MGGQRETAKIMGSELHFEAGRGRLALREAFRKSSDRLPVSEIELLESNITARDYALYAADRISTFASITSGEDDGSTGPYER